MKLTKETLKRIIKEEMSSLLNELGEPSFGNPDDPRDDMFRSITGHGPEDLPFNNPLMALQKALETSGGFKIEPDQRNPEALSIETPTDTWTASVVDGELILDFDSNSEQIVGKDEALKFLLNL
tara:strand:+ start:1024 stop:1395 length:372 start_codon:yes stop_codon:yes gene_type:complete